MKWLFTALIAMIAGAFVLFLICCYALLDTEAQTFRNENITADETAQMRSELLSAFVRGADASGVIKKQFSEREMNVLIDLLMRYDKGANAVASTRDENAIALSDGYGENWHVVYEKGAFDVFIHINVFNPGVLAYTVGSHLNIQARFDIVVREGVCDVRIFALKLSKIQSPLFFNAFFRTYVKKQILLHIKSLEPYAAALQIDYAPEGATITFTPSKVVSTKESVSSEAR